MEVETAVITVLEQAGEALHWTVIQDRALRSGYLDPFETPDVRGVIGRALRELVRSGTVIKVEQGTYRLA
jgi:hypothetical protein